MRYKLTIASTIAKMNCGSGGCCRRIKLDTPAETGPTTFSSPLFSREVRRMLTLACVAGWVVIGLVAGTMIRPRHPGAYSPGLLTSVLLGITGALLGGGASCIIGYEISPTQGAGWFLPIIGAITLPSI